MTERSEFWIAEVTSLDTRQVNDLANILIAVVAEGASVGYLAPLAQADAITYWRQATAPNVVILIAERPLATGDRQIIGTVQLEASLRPNGAHRAEINKLLVHPGAQRQGIASALMREIEAIAQQRGRFLLHLDTREGDPSNSLYRNLGWTQAGTIPNWARSSAGELTSTVFYYKELPGAE